MSQGNHAFAAWAEPVEAVLAHHGTDADGGLTDKQIAEKRLQYGYNELTKQPGKPLWKLVLEQFDDMLVKVPDSFLCRAKKLLRGVTLQETLSPSIQWDQRSLISHLELTL